MLPADINGELSDRSGKLYYTADAVTPKNLTLWEETGIATWQAPRYGEGMTLRLYRKAENGTDDLVWMGIMENGAESADLAPYIEEFGTYYVTLTNKQSRYYDGGGTASSNMVTFSASGREEATVSNLRWSGELNEQGIGCWDTSASGDETVYQVALYDEAGKEVLKDTTNETSYDFAAGLLKYGSYTFSVKVRDRYLVNLYYGEEKSGSFTFDADTFPAPENVTLSQEAILS